MTPTLYVGNKNYSSWSLRPWLALKWALVPFNEVVIPLDGPGYGKSQIPSVLAISPTGRVPVLALGEVTIWDSLAIGEWAAENGTGLFPSDPTARALCRSAIAEMHAGFPALRRDLSMNIRRRTTPRPWAADTAADLKRLDGLWTSARSKHREGGPFLFGVRTLADAFYAPVATRIRTYGVTLSHASMAYCETVLADPAFKEWEAAALVEPWTIASTEAL